MALGDGNALAAGGVHQGVKAELDVGKVPLS